MKLLNFIFMGLIISFLFSCSSKPSIVGEWKLDDMNIEKAIQDIPTNQKQMARDLMKTLFVKMKGEMKAVFEENGQFRIESPAPSGVVNIESGEWELTDDHKKLITIVDEKRETMEIIELSDKRLIFSMNISGSGDVEVTFIH